jgi:hypothetical protein
MYQNHSVLRLGDPDVVQDILNSIGARTAQKMSQASEACGHEVIQLKSGKVVVIFLIGLVVFKSKKDFLRALEDGSLKTFDYLDTIADSFVPRKKNSHTNLQDWLLEAVRYYRNLDFFQKYKRLSDADIVHKFYDEFYSMNTGLRLDNFEDLSLYEADLCLLSWDMKRVFWGDMECDIHPDNRVYPIVLSAWKAISRKKFLPKNIRETWDSRSGPIRVEFTYENQPCEIILTYNDDWIDLTVIEHINSFIHETGFQFESCLTDSQDLVLIVLHAEEKRKLKQERGFRFG